MLREFQEEIARLKNQLMTGEPGVGGGARFWLGLVASQTYIALRVAIRLQFAASQIALFQSRLAHAGYVAAPVPTWPESPMADAIRAD